MKTQLLIALFSFLFLVTACPESDIKKEEKVFACTSKQISGDYHSIGSGLVEEKKTNQVWSLPDHSLHTPNQARLRCANGFRLPSKDEITSLQGYARFLFADFLLKIRNRAELDALNKLEFCYYYSLNDSPGTIGRLCEYDAQCTDYSLSFSTQQKMLSTTETLSASVVCKKD